MGWTTGPTRQLIIPSDAGPNDPRIVIGGPLPADLVAYYTSHGETAISGTIYYKDAVGYEYEVLVKPAAGTYSVLAYGGRDSGVGTVNETYRIDSAGGSGGAITVGKYNGFPVLSSQKFINGAGLEIVDGFAQIHGTVPNASGLSIFGVASFNFSSSNIMQLDLNANGGDFAINFRSQGRGLLWETAAAAATGALAAEGVFLTAPNATYKAGRAYLVQWVATANQTIAGLVNYKFRRTNIGGVNKASWAKHHAVANALSDGDWVIVVNATGADITDTAVLTVAPGAGTVNVAGGAGVTVAAAQCWDCGAAADFTLRTQF